MDDDCQEIRLLRDAKERLFVFGWAKGSFGLIEGPNCLVGAIMEGTLRRSYTAASCSAEKALTRVAGRDVMQFNDDENTSFDDIIDLIDRTIKTLEMKK